MGDYCLRLPEQYVHQLEAIGEDLRTLHKTLQTEGRVDALSTGDVHKALRRLASVGRGPDSDTGLPLPTWLSTFALRPNEQRLWASWQLEVLLATGMPKPWARASATDASAAASLLVRGYHHGMQQQLHLGLMSGGTHVSSLVLTSSRFKDLAALDDKSLLTTLPTGTTTLAGLAVQAAALVGLTIPAIRDESAASLLASLPLVAPVSVAHLRQYWTHQSSGDFVQAGEALGRGLLRTSGEDS